MSIQQTLSEASESQRRRLAHDPRLYIRNAWRHPNDRSRRYDFKTTGGETDLRYLLDDQGPMNPAAWGDINILLMARGMLKTTTLLAIVNWCAQFYGPRGWEGYMTAPRQGQTEEFVEKLREKIEESGLDQYREKDSYGHQKFKFDREGTPVYSHFKTDTGWGEGDSLRGPHSHFGIVDEFQDMNEKAFNAGFKPVIDQELAGVDYFPAIFILGTPKMEGSFFEEMWERSDKREWYPDRGEVGTWVAEDDPQSYGEGEDRRVVRGWHISRVTGPLHSHAEIQENRDIKTPQEFKNEDLAEFYSPEDHLISERHINQIADNSETFVSERRYEDSWVTVGIDWGGGDDRKAADTVVVAMEHMTDEDYITTSVVNDVQFLDTELSKSQEFEELEKTIMRFDADRVVVDEGYGSTRREDLQNGNGTIQPDGYEQVVGCRYGNISDTSKVKWKDEEAQQLFTADKSHVAKSFVNFVKSERLVLPASNLQQGSHGHEEATGTKLYRQLTAPYEERKETVSGTKKTRIVSRSSDSDDAFDAMTYAWMGYHIDKIGPTTSEVRFVTTSAPGF